MPTTVGPHLFYRAKPEGSGPWPALIVIQEWWGLDQQTRSIADRFAAEGYLAFAPDLYHGELAQPGDHQRAASLAQKHGPNAVMELQILFDAFRGHPDCNGKIGSVGFCFGGRMSLAPRHQSPARRRLHVSRRRDATAVQPVGQHPLSGARPVRRSGSDDSD